MLPAFSWQAVLTQWEFAPVVTTAVVVSAALYLWGVVRVARRHPARPWPAWRTGIFLAGLAVVAVAIQSGIGAYDEVLAWDHMIQHLLLLMVAPPLLVIGQPFALLLHASRNPLHTWAKRLTRSRAVTFLTWPVFGLVAYTVTVAGTHLTGLADSIITNPVLHNAEHVLYLVVGYLFFLPLLGREPIRWRLSYPVRFVILVLAMPVDTFTGVVLGYAQSGFAAAGPRPPAAPSPVEDAHWAGAAMWIGGDAIMLAFMMVVVFMWAHEDQAGPLGGGWLERAREASFEGLVAGDHGPAGSPGREQVAFAAPSGSPPAPPAGEGPPAQATTPPARGRGRATIDDDEHLAVYNAYLARLNGTAPARDPDR